MQAVLSIENLTKSFGSKVVLNDLSMRADPGRIVGLMGPNGSGKTTLLKTIAGLLKHQTGTIRITNCPPGTHFKSCISYLPDSNPLYPWMKIGDAQEFYQDHFSDFNPDRMSEFMKNLKLDAGASVKSLSKGALEKLNLSLVLSRETQLYLLDEPLGGLDPLAREFVMDMILSAYQENAAMLITTHMVGEIERLFDDVLFMTQGKLLLYGNADALRQEHGCSVDKLYREVFSNEEIA